MVMEIEARDLADHLLDCLHHYDQPRLIIGVSGVPGSGKSTFAKAVVDKLNDLNKDSAVLVGLDGWHYTRAQLDEMPDPQLAHERRGAHWTFDAPAYVQFVSALRDQTEGVLTAPTFDHALKDPTPDALEIHPHHTIVLIEGLYTFLAIEPWITAGKLLDERWWMEINALEARARLIRRHVATGIVDDEEAAVKRADQNDVPNGQFVKQNRLPPTRAIFSH